MERLFQGAAAGVLHDAEAGCEMKSDPRSRPQGAVMARLERGLAGLATLETHWRRLADLMVPSRFIHAFEWQAAYLRHLAKKPDAVHYFSFFVHDEAIAIFPLLPVRRSVGRLPLRLWESPTHPHLILGEPLVSPSWASPSLFRNLAQALDACREQPWDALHLPNLLEDALTLRLLEGRQVPRTHLQRTDCSMFFPCQDMSTALANCSAAFKRNLRRQGKKLAQRGELRLRLTSTGDELKAAFGEFLRLEASGWKGHQGLASAIGLHPQLHGFYGQLLADFSSQGNCRIALLEVNGVAIAAQFCLLADATLYIQKIAYDEAWHAEAPGSQLLYRVLEHCCADPEIRQLSLVTGPQWAVGRWNPECHAVWEAYVFNTSLRGCSALALRRFKSGIWLPLRQGWRRRRKAASEETTP